MLTIASEGNFYMNGGYHLARLPQVKEKVLNLDKLSDPNELLEKIAENLEGTCGLSNCTYVMAGTKQFNQVSLRPD